MADFNRKKARNTLNKQRRRFEERGASPSEIADYFGVPYATQFGKLSDTDLKILSDKVAKMPQVKVMNDGRILPTRYINSFNEWFSAESLKERPPMRSGLASAMASNFMTQDRVLKDTKKRKLAVTKKAQKAFSLGLKEIGVEKNIVDSISKLKPDDFWKIFKVIKRQSPTENLFVTVEGDAKVDFSDSDLEKRNKEAEKISNIFKQFKEL